MRTKLVEKYSLEMLKEKLMRFNILKRCVSNTRVRLVAE